MKPALFCKDWGRTDEPRVFTILTMDSDRHEMIIQPVDLSFMLLQAAMLPEGDPRCAALVERVAAISKDHVSQVWPRVHERRKSLASTDD